MYTSTYTRTRLRLYYGEVYATNQSVEKKNHFKKPRSGAVAVGGNKKKKKNTDAKSKQSDDERETKSIRANRRTEITGSC